MAQAFSSDLIAEEGVRAVGIASRDRLRAEALQQQFGFEAAFDSYAALVEDPRIEIVYVATPHPLHAEHCLLALRAGKAVLCEKPWTMRAADAERVAKEAKARSLLCMEAMWTRHFPAIRALGALLADGRIGTLRTVHADFSQIVPYDPQHRLFAPDLGGGALLDLGIYPIALCQTVWGTEPRDIRALSTWAPNGVDLSTTMIFGYPEGAHASLRASFEVRSSHRAELLGTKGRISVPDFFHPDTLILEVEGEAPQTMHFPYRGRGWGLQVEDAMRCLREGRLESAIVPIADSLATMRTLDRIRAEIGLRYPGDPADTP